MCPCVDQAQDLHPSCFCCGSRLQFIPFNASIQGRHFIQAENYKNKEKGRLLGEKKFMTTFDQAFYHLNRRENFLVKNSLVETHSRKSNQN
jgi:hypothetical protein